MSEAKLEMVEGYMDGGDPNAPEPSENRSYSYRHGFAVGRADMAGKPAFGRADVARELAASAEAKDAEFRKLYDRARKRMERKSTTQGV